MRKKFIFAFALLSMTTLFFACNKEGIEQPDMDNSISKETIPLTRSESIALVVQQKGTYKISQSEALEKLDRFAASNSECTTANIQVTSTMLKTNLSTGKDMYYEVVFESEKGIGFSLLSADERVQEVLCYSEVGSIADTSFNKSLKFCIELVDLYVEEQTKEMLDIDALVLSANEKLALNKNKPFPTTKGDPPFDPNTWTCQGMGYEIIENVRLKAIPGGWHQRPPYNDSLPFVAGIGTANGRAYAGCVPVATAQIMSYHQKAFKNYITTSTWPSMINYPSTSVELRNFIKEIFNRIIVDNIPNGASYGTGGSGIPTTISVSSVRSFLTNNGFFMDFAYLYNYPGNLSGFEYAWEALSYGPTYMEGICAQGGHAWVVDGAKTVLQQCYELWTLSNGMQTFEHRIDLCSHDLGAYVRCDWGWGNPGAPDTSLPINTWFADGVFMVTRNLGNTYNFNSGLYIVRKIYYI